MTFHRLTDGDSKTLLSYLQQAFFRILPDGEMAQTLNQAIPEVITLANGDTACDRLELECYRSSRFRSKLLLLVMIAKHLTIRNELKLLENSLIPGRHANPIGKQELLLDTFDELQTRIVSWKRPIGTSFIDSDVAEGAASGAHQNGFDRISGLPRWQ